MSARGEQNRDDRATEAQLRAAGVGEPALALFRRRMEVRGETWTSKEIDKLRGYLAPAAPPAGPVTLVLPWSALISDNRHRGPVSSRADAAAYKLARTRAHAEAAEQWGPRAPFSGRIALVARIFPPNAQRRDVGNFAKCVKDALSGVAYADDVQVVDERWIKAAIDVDRPRAEILIEELQ